MSCTRFFSFWQDIMLVFPEGKAGGCALKTEISTSPAILLVISERNLPTLV